MGELQVKVKEGRLVLWCVPICQDVLCPLKMGGFGDSA